MPSICFATLAGFYPTRPFNYSNATIIWNLHCFFDVISKDIFFSSHILPFNESLPTRKGLIKFQIFFLSSDL